MSTNHIQLAYTIALDVKPFANARVAALLVCKNRVIAVGTNWSKTHPVAQRFQKNKKALYPHAEVVCLHNAQKRGFSDWSRATLYIARAKKINGVHVPGLSKPCFGCLQAVDFYGVGKISWTKDYDLRVQYE